MSLSESPSPPQHQWTEEAWGEQRYYWENGFFCLSQRPPYCDRGRWQVFLEAQAVDDRGWSRYFFSKDNAKEEVASWLANWQQLKTVGYTCPYPHLNLACDPCWKMDGTHCTVSLTALTNDAAVGRFVGIVQVHSGSEAEFTVDYHDLFPRFYFSQEIAIGELTAWMACRKQVAQ